MFKVKFKLSTTQCIAPMLINTVISALSEGGSPLFAMGGEIIQQKHHERF